jgi:hypothetical protein
VAKFEFGVGWRTDKLVNQDLIFRNCRIGLGQSAMDQQTSKPVSLIRRHAADALRRARKLPIGHARNNLRQLAMGLLWLERKGFVATVNEGKLDLRKTNDLRE